jgi:hypothetical protein
MVARYLLLLALLCSSALADDTVEWLLQGNAGATTRPALSPASDSAPATNPLPATAPAATQPASRATQETLPREGARPGTLTLSDGTVLRGLISTTPDRPIRVWQESVSKYADLPWALINRMEAVVLWERDEREWRFVSSGSDIKEYTGRTYPARETAYKIVAGQTTYEGATVAPIYVQTGSGEHVLALHKRSKGDLDAPLKTLVYVKSIVFD